MKKQTGFTIIELVITLALIAIIAGFAAPALQDLVNNNRSTAQANNFLSAVKLARSEAIKRRGPVRLQAINYADDTNEWGNGWQVVAGVGPGAVAGNDANLIRQFEALSGNSVLDSANANGVSAVVFDGQGLVMRMFQRDDTPAPPPLGTEQFQLTFTNCGEGQARNVWITSTGNSRIERVDCP